MAGNDRIWRHHGKILDLWGTRYTLRDQVHAIPVMTRAIWGSGDGTVPLRGIRAGLATIPQHDLVVLPGLGHSPHLEAPEQFAHAALEFLARGSELPVIVSED